MELTRRSMLIGTAGAFTMGKVFTEVDRLGMTTLLPHTDDVGVAIGVGADQSLDGLSDTVTIERVEDPFESEDDDGRGDGGDGGDGDDGRGDGGDGGDGDDGRGDGGDGGNGDENPGRGQGEVLHITSKKGEGAARGGQMTFDIALSLLDVSDRGLTVEDIAMYDGDGYGFAYEWAATENDMVGFDTDHQGLGSPDEVWFFLDTGDDDREARTDRSGPFFANAKPVFRTLYADADADDNGFIDGHETGEWNKRNVAEEMDAFGWKELSLEQRQFDRSDNNILDDYGGATVVGVGLSRGDPYWGPSVLDSYYRNFELAGEEYTLPANMHFGGR